MLVIDTGIALIPRLVVGFERIHCSRESGTNPHIDWHFWRAPLRSDVFLYDLALNHLGFGHTVPEGSLNEEDKASVKRVTITLDVIRTFTWLISVSSNAFCSKTLIFLICRFCLSSSEFELFFRRDKILMFAKRPKVLPNLSLSRRHATDSSSLSSESMSILEFEKLLTFVSMLSRKH